MRGGVVNLNKTESRNVNGMRQVEYYYNNIILRAQRSVAACAPPVQAFRNDGQIITMLIPNIEKLIEN